MKNKKAQAAIEFLTTYGWALLIIALVLVALGWLGVFPPQNPINQFCQFPIQTFECNDVLLTSGQAKTAVQLRITNNFGRRVYLCPPIMAYCSAKEPVPTTGIPSDDSMHIILTGVPDACGDPNVANPWTIEPGEQTSTGSRCFDETGTMRFTPIGSKYTGKIYIFYSFEGDISGKARMIVGNLVAQVQPA